MHSTVHCVCMSLHAQYSTLCVHESTCRYSTLCVHESTCRYSTLCVHESTCRYSTYCVCVLHLPFIPFFLSIDISCLLDTLVNIDKDLFSLRPWSTDSLHLSSHPLHYALNANFLLMNLSKLHDFNFNPLNFKSADVDYHLRLLANQYTVCVPSEYSFVKKLIKSEKPVSLADLSPQLVSNPDRLVTSLHHDASSLLSYPGPLLLETFLLHKSHSLFPTAHTPNHPVLMIDNYINLGPKVHITLLPCKQLEELINKDVLFGGLVLYLCEGLVSSHMLQKMKFISGACLLLITRDCKALVKEVSRLDIEEYWHFKLRDEFQTACSDQYQPLFFLTGKYVSSTIDVS